MLSALVNSAPPSDPQRRRSSASGLRLPASEFSSSYFRLSNSHPKARSSFTLIELMVVIGIIVLFSVLIVPAFTSLKGSGDITNTAYAITGVLEQARNYALANNTYVWVGFYEEDSASSSPTAATPAYPGRGRLVIGSVYSIDGTKIFEDADPVALLPATRVNALGKLTKIEGLHVTDIGAPPSPAPLSPAPNSLAGRPDGPYTDGSPFAHFNRISSDSTDATKFSFTTQGYVFYKTIRFNPRGEANINSTYSLKHAAELALRPTHRNIVDANSANVVAIQISGVSGNFKIYRQ